MVLCTTVADRNIDPDSVSHPLQNMSRALGMDRGVSWPPDRGIEASDLCSEQQDETANHVIAEHAHLSILKGKI